MRLSYLAALPSMFPYQNPMQLLVAIATTLVFLKVRLHAECVPFSKLYALCVIIAPPFLSTGADVLQAICSCGGPDANSVQHNADTAASAVVRES